MRLNWLLLLLAGLCSCGLGAANDSGDPSWQEVEPAPAPNACHPADEPARRANNVYQFSSESVHELITCGSLQVGVARSLVLAIFRSNADVLPADLQAKLGKPPSGLLSHQTDNSWRMAIPNMTGSTFDVRFFAPDGVTPIADDPFRLDSYLVGATVTNESLTDGLRLTFAWKSLGPLGHLLGGGKPLANPIVLNLNKADLAMLGTLEGDLGKIGPFAQVADLRMTGTAHVVTQGYGVSVEMTAHATAAAVASIADSGSLDLEKLTLEATDGKVTLTSLAANVKYVADVGLTGTISFQVNGTDVDLRIASDFGTGAAYPHDVWTCP